MDSQRHKRKREEMEDDDDDAMEYEQMMNNENSFFMLFLGNLMTMATVIFEWEYLMEIPHPLIPDTRFDPANLGTSATFGLQSEHLFRFSVEQLKILVISLRLPTFLWTPERDAFNAMEGLCIVLRRLVYPVRYLDMVQLFGRSRASLSHINWYMMMCWLYVRWFHLSEFDPQQILPVVATWAASVAARAPDAYRNVALFIDGHVQFTCRPCPAPSRRPVGVTGDDIQRAQYCYYKHHHGFKNHALISPSGMVVHYYGTCINTFIHI